MSRNTCVWLSKWPFFTCTNACRLNFVLWCWNFIVIYSCVIKTGVLTIGGAAAARNHRTSCCWRRWSSLCLNTVQECVDCFIQLDLNQIWCRKIFVHVLTQQQVTNSGYSTAAVRNIGRNYKNDEKLDLLLGQNAISVDRVRFLKR